MRAIAILALVLSIALLAGCMGGTYMKTVRAGDTDSVSGTFRVILYGHTHPRDLETAVILDLKGDGYEISPVAPAFRYYVVEGLTAPEAFETAKAFLADFWGKSRLLNTRKILDPRGNVIGYDVRYYGKGFVYGFDELLSISYRLMEDGKTVQAVIMSNWERKLAY